VTDEAWMSEPVVDVPEPKRKRRKFRKYPRPECSPVQRAALLELQQGRCAICGAEGENWLRVLGTAELPHIDQGVRQ
jgi:hypothetical protein